ncbi:MAG TPA: UvrD-helicase domain-containing protein [bacterium]|jgi:ATP-dependent exoDNAse (exonuclease V) beta subunit
MIDLTLPLVDAADRDLAANDLSNVFLVEAAAGTGKTTLLVSRILTIVRETLTPLSNIVAITFTEKAAGELKIKLRERLEAAAREEDEYVEQYRRALQNLDAMPVSTIHSFCRELIAQRPVEAGVDPGFSVTDQATARTLTDEAWQGWITAQFSGECPAVRPFLERGLETEGNGASLRDLFEVLNDYREDLDLLHVPCRDEAALREDVAAFCAEIRQALSLAGQCRDSKDTLAGELASLAEWFEHARWDDLNAATVALEERYVPHGGKKGRKDNWPDGTLETLRGFLFATYSTRADALLADITSFYAAPLIGWLKGAVEACAALKAERNTLDFHDLLITARDMLKESRAAREFFKARYDYVLVDEFQDTDPLQAEIIFFLAERADRFAESWDEVELDSVKLFIVGDPKQSIYRFRRADLDLYGRVKEKIAECGQCLSIRMNFRSDPVIIREVNALFGEWMTGPSGGRYEPDYAAMEPARAPGAPPTAIVLPPPPSLDLTQNADQLAACEAACIAEAIREMADGARTVSGPDGESRAVSYRDIGILYSATTHLTVLENALRSRSIPYQVSGGKDLPRRMEIQALRTVLAAIDNPFDGMHVVGALRSPFFACSDEELLEHRLSGGTFDYTSGESPVAHVQRSFDLLKRLHEQSRRAAPSETVAALLEETTGLQIFALKPQGESRAANLLKVLEIARALESGGHSSLHQLVRWLDRLEELRVGEEDSPIAESGDDVVQLMTFHKSKGLEFPVVFLYRMSQDHELRRAHCIVDRTRKAVDFSMASIRTAGYGAALEEERDRQWHETIRLLYVAMTRARDVLVVPAFWSKERSTETQDHQWFFKLLRTRFTQTASGISLVQDGEFTLHPADGYSLEIPLEEKLVLDLQKDVDPQAVDASRRASDQWQREKTRQLAKLDHREMFVKPSDHEQDFAAASVPLSQQTERAKRFGTFVHRILQCVHLPRGDNAEEVIASAARQFGMNDEECIEARMLLERVLSSELFAGRMGRCEQPWRELEFVIRLDGRLVEGSMDLVFMEEGRPVIVDFKTDRVTAETAVLRAQTYRHQAAAYVRALEEIIAEQVPEVLFYFVRPDTVISLPRETLLDFLL